MFQLLLILFAMGGRLSPNYTDEQLLQQYAQTGNMQLLGELYKRHSTLALGVCMKYLKNTTLAEDAVMDVFEKMLVDLRDKQVDNFKAWLYTVCKNHCLMQLRKQKTDTGKADAYNKLMTTFMENGDLPHHSSEDDKEQWLQLLEKAIHQLNDEQKQCIDLFYLQKKSYNDIEDITGYTNSKVKSYIQNGKRNLKLYMERERP